jgi:hypothetical protein
VIDSVCLNGAAERYPQQSHAVPDAELFSDKTLLIGKQSRPRRPSARPRITQARKVIKQSIHLAVKRQKRIESLPGRSKICWP